MKPEFTFSQDGNRSKLSVKGDLVALSGSIFKSNLEKMNQTKSDVELSINEVRSLDVSAIQIVKSFRQLLELEGRKLHVVLPASVELSGLLELTNFVRILKKENI